MSKVLWIVKSPRRAEGGQNWRFGRFFAYASGVRLGSRRDNVTIIGLSLRILVLIIIINPVQIITGKLIGKKVQSWKKKVTEWRKSQLT